MIRIVYVAIDNGIDGRDKDSILYAAYSDLEIAALFAADKSKAWRRMTHQTIDPAVAYQQALAKLNGIDRLVLGLKPWPDNTAPPDTTALLVHPSSL